MNELSLAGIWRCLPDAVQSDSSACEGHDFHVPGTTCENKLGKKQTNEQGMTKDTVRSLRQRYEYMGAVRLEREFDLPPEWENKTLIFSMERVMWFSDLWIDGEKIGRTYDSLCTPHIYRLPRLSSGRHTIAVRVDNRNLYQIDYMSSGYTNDTQSIWCGIIGDIKLTAYDAFHISNLQVYPDLSQHRIKIRLTIDTPLCSPSSRETACVSLKVGNLPAVSHCISLYHTRQTEELTYDMGDDFQTWDEFHPALYTLSAELSCGESHDCMSVTFGMREIAADGRRFLLNGRQIFLRGTLDCCVYPKTGYPPVDLEHWLKVCRTVKEYGLNHIRFHSWCPPEAAFTAADQTGVYVSCEMPFWLNTDVCALAAGDDPVHAEFFHREAVRISRCYGNHPSFLLFSNGNELLGDFEMLESLTTQLKALDHRRLYTLTSNFDRPVTPADDYFSAFRSNDYGIRCQYFHDAIVRDTCLDYHDGIQAQNVPVISFEVGQYCVYPDIREIEQYSGNLLPVNFSVIRDDLSEKNLLHKIGDFVYASGKLAALLYKEDIEASLRTKDMGGFELLGLHDYPGQCTATVGLLNSFWESKGIITPAQFREFCAPVVPLMKAKRIWSSGERFTAEFSLADFGEKPIKNPVFVIDLFDHDTALIHKETANPYIDFPLSFISQAMQIKAVLSIKGTNWHNSWDIFVYPETASVPNQVYCTDCIDAEAENILIKGGKLWLNVAGGKLAKPISGKFYPVFWSPAYFPSSNPCGIICEQDSHIFDGFPTEKTSNFQWYTPLEHSVVFDIHTFPRQFCPLVELVPNFFDNTRMASMFEAHIGNADVLVTGFDFSIDDIAVNHLRNSIIAYLNSPHFSPAQTLPEKNLHELFQ